MIHYRCYFIDERDHISSAADIPADGLTKAVEQSLTMLAGRPLASSIELWQGELRLYSSRRPSPRHQCHVYEGPPSKTLQTMATIIVLKLNEQVRCLYFNSPTMIAGLRSYLASAGVDVEHAVASGALNLSAEREHLASDRFDADAMLSTLERAVETALSEGYAGLWASGDMTWELGPERDAQELLKYERGLEELFRRQPALSGICQYHTDTLPRDLVEYGLAVHGSFVVNETLSRSNPYYLSSDDRYPHPRLAAVVDELVRTERPND